MSNPNFRRFPLTYDEVFDADIHRAINSAPVRRRSERVRELMRLGLAVESREGASKVRPTIPMSAVEVKVNEKPGAPQPSQTEEQRRKRRLVQFQPPS